jgi:hypothetical protein
LGGDGKANAWPWVKDLGLRKEVIGQLCHPLPREAVILTAAPQRAQPKARDMVTEGAECRGVKRHGMIGEVAPVRYSFIVTDFHRLLLAGFTGAHKTAT